MKAVHEENRKAAAFRAGQRRLPKIPALFLGLAAALVAGCAPTAPPRVSFSACLGKDKSLDCAAASKIPEATALETLRQCLDQARNSSGQPFRNVRVTTEGFSFEDCGDGSRLEARSYQFQQICAAPWIWIEWVPKRERFFVPLGGTGNLGDDCDKHIYWDVEKTPSQFVTAMLAVRYHRLAARQARALESFRPKAKASRELPQKPELPEAARRCLVVAEDALRSGDAGKAKAAAYFEQGLLLAPLWPEAYFNAALLRGEAQRYFQAADHMRHYLELCPDAPDARSAKDKVLLWGVKLQENGCGLAELLDAEKRARAEDGMELPLLGWGWRIRQAP